MVAPSYKDIENSFWLKVVEATDITGSIDDTVLGTLVKIFASETHKLALQLEELSLQMDVHTASGQGLDLWARNLGIRRKPAIRSTTIGSARSVRFTNLGGSQVIIPAQTRVWSKSNPQLAYYTTEALTLAAGEYETAHVLADEVGDSYNIPAGYIDSTNYAPNVITVTNLLPLGSGSYLESDDSLRERIIQALRHRAVFNKDVVVALLRQIPGIQDTIVLPMRRGYGTFDCIIVPHSVGDSENLRSIAQEMLDTYSFIGLSAKAISPVIRYVKFDVSLQFKPNTENQREGIRNQIKQILTSFIEQLPIEDGTGTATINFAEATSRIYAVSPSVLSTRLDCYLDGVRVGNQDSVQLNIGDKVFPSTITVQ